MDGKEGLRGKNGWWVDTDKLYGFRFIGFQRHTECNIDVYQVGR